MTYADWARAHPQAARDLQHVLGDTGGSAAAVNGATAEAQAQQQARLDIAHAGAYSWRNNVGATPARCPDCGAARRPVRYGLANDSAVVNRRVKSSDLILAIPREITPAMVGSTIAQFGSVEVKRPGWQYTGKGTEPGQAAWLALITRIGGYATFSTGRVVL